MPVLSLIAAMDNNRLIGCNNELPWRLPADLQHFKQVTMGKPIIMGRKTWESLGRPLPGRTNIAITRDSGYRAEGAIVVHSLESALDSVADAAEVMIIGGANLYAQAITLANRLYLTRIDEVFEGDAWFPEVDSADWELVASEHHEADESNPHVYVFETWERKA